MSQVIIPNNLGDLFTQNALQGGLNTSTTEVNTDPSLVATLKTQFGSQVFLISATHTELSSLDVPDYTNAFVSDVPANIGSMWSKLAGVWRPTNGVLNYSSHLGSLVDMTSAQQDQTLFTVPVIQDIMPNASYGSFIAVVGISSTLVSTFNLKLKISGKHYDTGNDSSTDVTFSIPAGELYCKIDIYLQTFNYDLAGQIKKRIHLGSKGYTDIVSSQPWSIKLTPYSPPLPEGLTLTLYQYALGFSYF